MRYLLLFVACISSLFITSLRAQTVDFTPLFKDWESACIYSKDFSKFVDAAIVYNEQRSTFSKGKIVLPKKYVESIKTMQIYNQDDFAEYVFPVTNGTYYGLPISHITVYKGRSNGFDGSSIYFNASNDAVKRSLANVVYNTEVNDFSGDEVGAELFGANPNKGELPFLNCDLST